MVSKKWKEGFFALYEYSSIQWYEKLMDKKPEGTIRVKEIAQFLSVGPYTRCVPTLPPRGDENVLICIPKDAQKKEKEILWIYCHDLGQLKWDSLIFWGGLV